MFHFTFRWAWRAVRIGIVFAGVSFIALLVLCFTPLPYRLYTWLGDGGDAGQPPDVIVVLGGGGIPSESGLMRTYAGAAAANQFKGTRVIVALTADGAPETSEPGRMKAELVTRGIAPARIDFEASGRNTREQATNVAGMLATNLASRLLLVTSPEHMKRARLSFEKAGFTRVAGVSAYPQSVQSNLLYDSAELGGSRLPVPDVGDKPMLRYQFWNSLRYEHESARELCALVYYWMMGWI